MKLKTIATCAALGLALSVMPLQAQNTPNDSTKIFSLSRLTVGGYGEAVYTRNFYSDNMFRYSHAERYKDAKGHGRVDLPHVVISLGYDFGKGWSMGSEIEFEHGGSEVAVEIEAEETGEFEHEIERGGEVALEQFWIQKSFGKGFNIRMGHIIVPVGQTNNARQKSITDFYDNIISVKNAYMGGMEGQRDETLSLHTYLKDNNADLDTKALNAIENALTKINAMKAPFVLYYSDASAGEAMEACQNLSDVMSEVKAEFAKIDRK